jgi:hypothetical protein
LADIIDFNVRREARHAALDERTRTSSLEEVAPYDAEAARAYEAPMPSVTPRRRSGSILSVVLDNVAAVWFGLLVGRP